ncbi:hypothetical protein D9757_003054 [Collybiopsis confluens]|uniref:Uncharacterized protein n=1 Tax=Collybiopsis confluens TaxID=2823264 RepID=A0A8H5HXM5_9AGAR|nr:hypothetical protein D9757_003054 [Collybiopsis confluens]
MKLTFPLEQLLHLAVSAEFSQNLEAINFKPQNGSTTWQSSPMNSDSRTFAIHIEFGKDDLDGNHTLLVYASRTVEGSNTPGTTNSESSLLVDSIKVESAISAALTAQWPSIEDRTDSEDLVMNQNHSTSKGVDCKGGALGSQMLLFPDPTLPSETPQYTGNNVVTGTHILNSTPSQPEPGYLWESDSFINLSLDDEDECNQRASANSTHERPTISGFEDPTVTMSLSSSPSWSTDCFGMADSQYGLGSAELTSARYAITRKRFRYTLRCNWHWWPLIRPVVRSVSSVG